jgi:PBP1b-binding outer membrane lipoprotein LpoB
MLKTRALISAAGTVVLLVTFAAGPGGCATYRVVERADPREVLDYQARFDEDDAREVSSHLVADALNQSWLDRWHADHGDRPVVIVGGVANDTSDYIETRLITKALERELLSSGRVALVAAADQRGPIRAERRQGQDWNRPETVKRMAHELGADMMLTGWIGENVEVSRNRARRIHYYQVSLELLDVESNQKTWIGAHEIEKRSRTVN